MAFRTVEISEDGRHLAKYRGFMTVSYKGKELGRIAIDELAAVIAAAHGLTYSNNLLIALAEQAVPFILCGPNYMPLAFLWTTQGHYEQGGRMSDQADASKPLRKTLWAQLVRAKVEGQISTLTVLEKPSNQLKLLSKRIRSGDPDNIEAQAARYYWPLLFGDNFRRDRFLTGTNSLLNYVYTVLRSGTARSIMAAGLHPALGLAHRQRTNGFALADDLMEPFRPIADLLVYDLVSNGITEINRDTKKHLVSILSIDINGYNGISSIAICLQSLANSLVHCYAKESKVLKLPKGITAINN